MDVLESIKQKLRKKPNLNKPEDIFVYVQHKIDPKSIIMHGSIPQKKLQIPTNEGIKIVFSAQ